VCELRQLSAQSVCELRRLGAQSVQLEANQCTTCVQIEMAQPWKWG
jgi:hypothetical protein